MKLFHSLLSLWFLMALNGAMGQDPDDNHLTTFATGLHLPVCIANAGDKRLFVVDQTGYIIMIDSAGNVNPIPYLDIHEKVVYGGERGLLGLAFDPNYKENGYFYVNYIGKGDSTHISRFSVSDETRDIAYPQSEFSILTIFQPHPNHKGGHLCFGPDGYLYIGLGDGGGAGDPENRAQNLADFHGKILRIDVDHGNRYIIPRTNPFYKNEIALKEIWAMGLRNPWRFSFDRFTGDLWIADVGQDKMEEVNFQPSTSLGGENYGWRCYEGKLEYNQAKCRDHSNYKFPVYTYPHGDECSIIGGYVYRGSKASPFYGQYFFADYCSDRIWTLHHEADTFVKQDYGQFPNNSFSTFGEDANGQLYIAGLTSGTIFRVVDNVTGLADEAVPGIKIVPNPFTDKIVVEGINYQGEIHFELYDISGRIIFDYTTKGLVNELSPGKIPAGIYFLRINMGMKKFGYKVVKVE